MSPATPPWVAKINRVYHFTADGLSAADGGQYCVLTPYHLSCVLRLPPSSNLLQVPCTNLICLFFPCSLTVLAAPYNTPFLSSFQYPLAADSSTSSSLMWLSVLLTYCVFACVGPEDKSPPDFDNNNIDMPDQISEPRRRKMSLRASVIGQPGILAGLHFFLHVLA